MKRIRRNFVVLTTSATLLGGALVPFNADAQGATFAEFPGVVVKVSSGDRLVLDTGDRRFNITLAQITAPPGQTTAGASAREALSALCYGQAATLMVTGTALDGSTIGKVSCAGVDVAQEQLRRGLARLNEPFAQYDSVLRTAEHEARANRAGIWAQ